ncbi:helix-turn-helix transcriptional regulator [Pedomonas sp. V897]|uniref:helix-turn-helix transcriptional regulator n=1 Tax=Pedomonas sp. V897 TaxID=3446482 RepID=UPI003EDEF07E
MRLGEVLRLTGWSRTTLWRKTKTGQFPRPAWGRKRGEAWYWRISDIRQWAQLDE